MKTGSLESRVHELQKDEIANRLRFAESADEGLSVGRTDIEFFNTSTDRVAIEIRVTNRSDGPSPCDALVTVRAAPFGAFVPWQPVATLPLPVLAPGQVRCLRLGAVPVRPQPLGSPDRVPPRKLLTALDLGDLPPESSRQNRTTQQAPASRALPADLMEVLLRETPHWIGNINVLVGKADVERHRALALRIYPGRMNLAWFFVGSGGHDAYAFRVDGLASAWDAKLFDMTTRQSLILQNDCEAAIAADRWIPCEGTRVMVLALRAPKPCSAGAAEVHVTQHSTGRTAVVEFTVDPAANGRGCYAV
jgi:hypothetical protein